MSNNEDYLDDLLNSVSGRNDKKDITELLKTVRKDESKAARERESKKHRREFGQEFYREFEQELKDAAEDEFIRDFELELDTEEAEGNPEVSHNSNDQQMEQMTEEPYHEPLAVREPSEASSEEENPLIEEDSLIEEDQILNEAEDPLMEEPLMEEPLMEEPLMEEPLVEESLMEEPLMEEPLIEEPEEQIIDETALDAEGSEQNAEVDDLMNLLSGLSEDQELSDIGALLKADEEDVDITDGATNELDKLGSIDELSDIKSGKKKKEKDKSKKNGFFAKLAKLLFGDDEEEPQVKVEEEGTLEGISGENLDILRELDSPTEGDKKSNKEKKKKEKKEKKEKEPKPKKEKVKKEKVPKEKKPKEPDLSPPLPKKPVILIAIMAVSIFLLIFLGQQIVGYSNNLTAAKTFYKNENYTRAYATIAGMSMKTADQKFLDQCLVMSMVQEEYNSYVALMNAGQNDMALDSLVRGIGRYDKYYDKADKFGILPEYNKLESQIEQTLKDQFGVSKDQALELYKMRSREDYSKGIRRILDKLGLN